MSHSNPALTPHDVRCVAVHARVDERTVRSYLRSPSRVRPSGAQRIETALRALGFAPRASEVERG